MIKSNLTLAPQTLLPIISKDEYFEHFVKDIPSTVYFSNLISTSDFSRVMSLIHQLIRKKEPIACLFHLKQKKSLSLLVGMKAHFQDEQVHITLHDISTLDEKHLKGITYQTFTKEELLKYV
jgi:hypothetical protein